MTQVEKLLTIARAEIGVAEDPIGSNNVKYNTAYYGREVSGERYAWCMVFVWWCFWQAGLSDLFYGGGKTASCTTLMKWAQREGRFFMGDYKAGDVFLYQFDEDSAADHTGIYTGQVDGRGRYLVIEGNHNNRVEMVARSDSELWGAFRPEWEEEPAEAPQPTPAPAIPASSIALPEIRMGDTGSTVKAMQILLVGWGYRLPHYGADGDFGAETRSAVRSCQLRNGLEVDGICGIKTWRSLLGVK